MEFKLFDPDTASKTVTAMIDRAARIATGSQMRHKHGVVVTLGGSIVSIGVNIPKNAPVPYIPYDYLSTHAEISALSGLKPTLAYTVYSVRIGPTGNYLLSRPCIKCTDYMLKWTNVKRIIHT